MIITANTWMALQSFTADYWRRVDAQSEQAVDDLYLDEGVMELGRLRCEGRAAIGRFFTERAANEKAACRTTRHLVSNFLVLPVDAGQVRVLTTIQVMAGNGGWPMVSAPPATVGDFYDDMVEIAPGAWRIRHRRADVVFTGPNAATFIR